MSHRTRAWVVAAWFLVGCPSLPPVPGGRDRPQEWWDANPEATLRDVDDDGREIAGRDTRDVKDGGLDGEGVFDGGCVPQCWGRVCGPNGCGGVCGICPPGTACSYDRSMCVSQSIQKPLGGRCGATEECQPRIAYPGGTYPNPRWPGCTHDQCLEGPCVYGFCSRPCRMMQDVRVNGTDLVVPDGIEDPDSPVSDCEGGVSDLFEGGFVCVLVEPGASEGLCHPAASFRPCEANRDCPSGEACGFLMVRGNLERRCLAAPKGANGFAESCGYDRVAAQNVYCESWACTEDGCTMACLTDDDCATQVGGCDSATGLCTASGGRCEADGDCSAWVCRTDVVLADLGVPVQACGPRGCQRDSDCRDPSFYCRHEAVTTGAGQVQAAGYCARRQKGGEGLGQPCDDDTGDGRPDVLCQNKAYCVDGRCGAMCVEDKDCAGEGIGIACGWKEFETGTTIPGDVPVPVPVCQWIGSSGASCQVRDDCAVGVCSPWLPAATGALEMRCMEPPAGSVGLGDPCGEPAWGQTCDTRVCLGASVLHPGFCSTVCRDERDCPDVLPQGTGFVKFLCEAVRFYQAGTVYLADDAYVSWCLPVPAESTLQACEPVGYCPVAHETCRAVVRSGEPGGLDRVEYRCVRTTTGADVGALCNPDGGGKDCKTGICAPTAVRGVGFCSTPCENDLPCLSLAGGSARCVPRIVLPRDPPAPSLTVRECRIVDACVTCRDDRDCPDPALRCANVASLPYWSDLRCAPVCEHDEDCAAWGQGVVCQEVDAPLETSRSGKAKVCSPILCP